VTGARASYPEENWVGFNSDTFQAGYFNRGHLGMAFSCVNQLLKAESEAETEVALLGSFGMMVQGL